MMKRIVLIAFLFFLSSFQILGQDSEVSLPKWYVNLGGNAKISISKYAKGIPSDYLFDYGQKTLYPQLSFMGIYFFHPKWGVTLKGNVGIPAVKNSKNADFENSLIEYYQNTFFVTSTIAAQYDPHENADGVYLGITYRKRKGKLVYLPQFLIGMTSFRIDQGNAYLKEKGTNTIFQISYSNNDGAAVKEFLTIAPAFSLGYNFSKKWMINFDFQYGFFLLNTTIEEEKRNTFTEEIELQTIIYKKGSHFINLGCSITRTF